MMPPPRVCSQGPPSSPGRGRLGAPGTTAVGLGRVVIVAVLFNTVQDESALSIRIHLDK